MGQRRLSQLRQGRRHRSAAVCVLALVVALSFAQDAVGQDRAPDLADFTRTLKEEGIHLSLVYLNEKTTPILFQPPDLYAIRVRARESTLIYVQGTTRKDIEFDTSNFTIEQHGQSLTARAVNIASFENGGIGKGERIDGLLELPRKIDATKPFKVRHGRTTVGFKFTIDQLNAAHGPLPDPAVDPPEASAHDEQTAVLAGGCFWGVEAVFEHLLGVSSVTAGYAGGRAETARYDIVRLGMTGHAESVKVTFDPARISYAQLLKVFFSVAHDPTQSNRQGPDSGTQYRSMIFPLDASQQRIAEAYIDQLGRSSVFIGPIVTEVMPLQHFYPAEAHHQDFVARNSEHPYVVRYDLPRLRELRAQFPALFLAASSAGTAVIARSAAANQAVSPSHRSSRGGL